jgi:hypothetical protein
LIADLAFTLVGDPSEPLEVAVAFGRSAGPPAPGVVVARAPGIVQIGTSFYGSASGIGELFIVFEQVDDVDGPGSALAWLGAGGDRSLMCLIELTTFAEDGSINGAPAFAVATGAFTAPDRVDALLLGADLSGDDLGMWLLPDLHSQRGRPQHLGWPFDPRLQPLTGFSGSPDDDSYVEMLMSVGDIDADGLDEVVVAAPDQRGERCLLSSARVTAAGGYELAAGEPVVLDTACSRAGQLALQDLDADDAPDIVLLAGAASGPHPLYVLWNDGAGGFSTDAVTQVQLEDEPQAFTLLRPSAAANSLLAYVSETQVYLLQAAGRARRFEDSLVQVELQLEHGTGITATDVDGDGIVDIVVADAGDIRVLRAELVP